MIWFQLYSHSRHTKGCKQVKEVLHTSWNALECMLQASEPTLFAVGARGCWGSSWFRNNRFMLNGARTHDCIHSPVCNSTASTKCHACKQEETKHKLQPYVESSAEAWFIKDRTTDIHIPWAIVAPRAPSMDPPLPPWTGAGGGAWLTAATEE